MNRDTHDGRLYRTANNLDAILDKPNAERHPITQLLMTLMWQLAIVIDYQDDKSKKLTRMLRKKTLNADCDKMKTELEELFNCSILSLSPCVLTRSKKPTARNLEAFLRRLRNALAHGNYSFAGKDPESKQLQQVNITFQDGKPPLHKNDITWQMGINGAELYKLQQYLETQMIA